jgi:hypothetical protein
MDHLGEGVARREALSGVTGGAGSQIHQIFQRYDVE